MMRANCNNNTLESQVSIEHRLKKLNEWQEEQKRLLDERQNMQRKMLGLEHQNMYEKLGLFHVSDFIGNKDKDKSGDKPLHPVKKIGNVFDSEIIEGEKLLFEGSGEIKVQIPNQRNQNNIGSESDEMNEEIKSLKPKRPFLKRGEGIKQRFKISPESLRLNNLPRYKYATNHPKIKNLQRRRLAPKAKPSRDSAGDKTIDDDYTAGPEKIDEIEKQFQQMLFKSKPGYSSTPDVKLPKLVKSSSSKTLPNVRLAEDATNEAHSSTPNKNLEQIKPVEPYCAITWSKVLNPYLVKPIPFREINAVPTKLNIISGNCKEREIVEDDENLTIFELLEQQAAEGTLDMNSSCLRNFMDHKNHEANQDNEIDILENKPYTDGALRPAVEDVLMTDSDDDSNSDVGQDYETRNQMSYISTYLSGAPKNNSSPSTDKVDFRVRFSEENTTCEYDTRDDIKSESLVLLEEETVSNKSSDLFQQFKDALFSALLSKNGDESNRVDEKTMMPSPPSALTEELQEKSNIIKLRLEELEKEISTFRSNNLELIRAKQECEMEKAHFNQERNEVMDRLKDDKIQMEIYLHDERMKIEEDRKKFEQQMRVQKQTLTNKEKKEVARLKEDVETLQMQLRQKDQLHASAQSRLRVQIKNLERDQKQLHEDIERLQKENKRLQSEKHRIERDGNNKMLMEINRNIAKLAPKLNVINSCDISPDYPDTNSGSYSKNGKSTQFSSAKSKMNTKLIKAPPNTRNTSRTNLLRDNEKTRTLHESDTARKRNNNSDNDEEIDDDEEENIMTELKMTEQNTSLKVFQSSSYSNTSKEILALKCNGSDRSEDRKTYTSDKGTIDLSDTNKRINTTNGNSETGENFRREIINTDGSRDIWYPNGNLKKISADGMNIRMLYFNKDIKETNVNEGTVKYYYADTNIWHTTYLDGLEILEFPNGQTEHRYKNGVVEIHLPDNSVKITNPEEKEKLEEWRFADGTNLVQMRNGDRILMLPNGQKEIHTKLNKRREYPDGTVKLVYPDGSQETRYSNGRIRLKDKDGNLVLDTERS